MKHITLIIIAMLFSVVAFAQQSLDTDFTQTKLIKVSGKTIQKEGHLTFDGNDHLTMTYTQPEGDYFIIDGNMVRIKMDSKPKTDLDASKVKMVQLQRSTLLNCLAGNWEQAAADNNAGLMVTEMNGLKTVSIVAQGKVQRGGYNSIELVYRLSDGVLTKLVLEEATGIQNTYELK